MPTKRKYTRNKQKLLIAASDRARAYRMRLEGSPVADIAESLGVSLPQAYRLIKAGSDEVLSYNMLDLKGLVLQQGERIEGILGTLYPLAKQGDMDAIDRCVKLFQRQAQLLGLDADPKTAQPPTNNPFVFNINFGESSPQAQPIQITAQPLTEPDCNIAPD